jgi:hypothetical protein
MRVRAPVVATAVIVVAPVVWFTHLAVVYALVPLSCRWDSNLPLHAATAVAVAGVVGSMWVARRARAAAGTADSITADSDRETDDGVGRDGTVQFLAVLLSGYFAFLVLMTAMVTVVVDRCA